MYEKRKILVEKAFEKAKKELKKENASKNYVAEYLSAHLEGLHDSARSGKNFARYYTDLVEKNQDRYIDEITQDQLSKYIGYKDYEDFCNNFNFTRKINDSTTFKFSINDDEDSVTGKLSKILITVSNSPVFNLPEFFTKQSNLGIIGVVLCGSLIVGTKFFKPNKDLSQKGLGIFESPKQCMYWNGKEYIPEHCNNTKAGLIAIDIKLVANFKKITRPDTIKSVKGVWYSKYQNRVEFFTADGKNPDNQKELHPVTERILEKYTQ